ncbi:hypothetical protein FHR24_001171 [Wenyingzhuangia heitensis]|uniref:Long-chain fatty acid transport protein n=1 Tax=Wenyingzhuangia heitensis TaxID=1487859 RepID=A0ABX0UCE9_9FLAO|nr:hypothetical protein [Wenyingzhuangia heitensis]NIJ44732.1 hypothetical protein [Wenyingzhuangia heitensis]
MKQNKNSVLIFIFSILISSVYAQEKQVSSLLSNYGLGTVFSEATVTEKAQGDLSVINNNTEEVISIANPALLSHLQLTSFTVSLNVLGSNVETQNSSYSASAISLSNLSLGIPLGPKGGVAIGLRANSAVGFEVESDNFYDYGNGGVNQAYFGIGYEVLKGLSLGAQISQYFGKTEKRQAFKGVQQSTVYDHNFNVSGTSVKLGAEYSYRLSERIEAKFGATGVLAYNVTATGTSRFFEAIQTDENIFSEIGDSAQEKNTEGTKKTPFKSVLGIGLGERNHWFAGLSYENQDALSYSGGPFNQTLSTATDRPLSFEASNKISLGGYIIPKKYALKNYFNRVAYRAGLKYENTGLVLNNSSVKNLGMSFGFGLPVGKRVSYLNLSFELGRIGDTSKNNYQEEYFNVGIDFSLSDKWFNKRVID